MKKAELTKIFNSKLLIRVNPSIVKFIKELTLTRAGHLIPVIGGVNIS